MLDPRFLKQIKSEAIIFPKRKALVCDMINPDNSISETTCREEEVKLALYLKTTVFPKLGEVERKRLFELIELYGEMCYENGDFNASLED